MLQLQHEQRALHELAIHVAVVTFETAPSVRAYIKETEIDWPILIDHDRRLYRSYGKLRGRLRDIWGVRTWMAYLKELVGGHLPKYSGGDTRQLGGDVLIDPDGIVRFHHIGRGPADRPSVAAIFAARGAQP